MDWLNLAALLVTGVLFAGIAILRKRRVNFSLLTIAALVVGVGLGLAFQGHVEYIAPIGTVYLNVLLAIVAPLIIISILSSATSLGSITALRTIGLRSAFWLLFTNLIAILLTLGIAIALGIGKGAQTSFEGINTNALENIVKPFSEVFIGFFPQNVVGDVADNNIIPIILFTILIAISYILVANKDAAKVRPFKALVDAVKEIIYKAVGFIIALTPYAVLTLTAVAVSNASGKGDQLWPLIGLLALAYFICIIDTFAVNAVLLRVWADVSPVQFFKKFLPAQTVAFTTQSSVGTLPVTTNVLTRRIGVPEDIANFTAPLGTTIGMPGCSGIWPVLVAVFGINALGINYTFQDYLVLVILGLLVSLGTAGVPGTATITTTTVLTAVGLPLELMAIVLPISTIADMARTLTNVTAAGVSATIVARQQGRLDDAIFSGTKEYIPGDSETEVDYSTDGRAHGATQPLDAEEVAAQLRAEMSAVPVGACSIDDRPVATKVMPSVAEPIRPLGDQQH